LLFLAPNILFNRIKEILQLLQLGLCKRSQCREKIRLAILHDLP
jgi:hypothetical protein